MPTRLTNDAADAIEELQAEEAKAAKRNAELHAELQKWVSAAEKSGGAEAWGVDLQTKGRNRDDVYFAEVFCMWA